jgi:HK97 family phage major capsid protein
VVFRWVSEAATRPETEPAFRQTELTAWELSGYLLASNTLLQDNAVGLDAWITQLITWGIEWQSDYAFLQGDGVGKPMGILNAPATVAVTKTVSAKFVYPDVAAMMGTLYWMLRGSKALVWVIHPSVIKYVLQLNDSSASSTTGRMLFIPIDQGAQAKIDESDGVQSIGWLHGIPVMVSQKLPAIAASVTGSVLLADCSKYIVAPRMEMEIATSPHVQFLQNQMAWRVVARMDGQPWLAGPVYYADGSTAASPFVALTT